MGLFCDLIPTKVSKGARKGKSSKWQQRPHHHHDHHQILNPKPSPTFPFLISSLDPIPINILPLDSYFIYNNTQLPTPPSIIQKSNNHFGTLTILTQNKPTIPNPTNKKWTPFQPNSLSRANMPPSTATWSPHPSANSSNNTTKSSTRIRTSWMLQHLKIMNSPPRPAASPVGFHHPHHSIIPKPPHALRNQSLTAWHVNPPWC